MDTPTDSSAFSGQDGRLQFKDLAISTGDIYGIPREEWLQLQSPVRYMGNEFGAVHKPFATQVQSYALVLHACLSVLAFKAHEVHK